MLACTGHCQQCGFKCGTSLPLSSHWIRRDMKQVLHHNPLVLTLDCRVASRCSETNWDCMKASKLPHFLRKRKEMIFNWAFLVFCGVHFSSGKYSTLLSAPPSIWAISGLSNHTTVHFLHLLCHENFISLHPLLLKDILLWKTQRAPATATVIACSTGRQTIGWIEALLSWMSNLSIMPCLGTQLANTKKPATHQLGAAIEPSSRAG